MLLIFISPALFVRIASPVFSITPLRFIPLSPELNTTSSPLLLSVPAEVNSKPSPAFVIDILPSAFCKSPPINSVPFVLTTDISPLALARVPVISAPPSPEFSKDRPVSALISPLTTALPEPAFVIATDSSPLTSPAITISASLFVIEIVSPLTLPFCTRFKPLKLVISTSPEIFATVPSRVKPPFSLSFEIVIVSVLVPVTAPPTLIAPSLLVNVIEPFVFVITPVVSKPPRPVFVISRLPMLAIVPAFTNPPSPVFKMSKSPLFVTTPFLATVKVSPLFVTFNCPPSFAIEPLIAKLPLSF